MGLLILNEVSVVDNDTVKQFIDLFAEKFWLLNEDEQQQALELLSHTLSTAEQEIQLTAIPKLLEKSREVRQFVIEAQKLCEQLPKELLCDMEIYIPSQSNKVVITPAEQAWRETRKLPFFITKNQEPARPLDDVDCEVFYAWLQIAMVTKRPAYVYCH